VLTSPSRSCLWMTGKSLRLSSLAQIIVRGERYNRRKVLKVLSWPAIRHSQHDVRVEWVKGALQCSSMKPRLRGRIVADWWHTLCGNENAGACSKDHPCQASLVTTSELRLYSAVENGVGVCCLLRYCTMDQSLLLNRGFSGREKS
jgi:hypothetical protein